MRHFCFAEPSNTGQSGTSATFQSILETIYPKSIARERDFSCFAPKTGTDCNGFVRRIWLGWYSVRIQMHDLYMEVMEESVMTPCCSQYFDRLSIILWLATGAGTCPICRDIPLGPESLVPNLQTSTTNPRVQTNGTRKTAQQSS